jgi:PAS domain S-box-containing protein
VIVCVDMDNKEEDTSLLILKNSRSAMLLVNKLGIIKEINPPACDFFGFTREELVDKAIEILLPEAIREKHVGLRDDYMKNPSVRQMGFGRRLMGRHKSGSVIHLTVGLNPIQMDGKPHVLATIAEIKSS